MQKAIKSAYSRNPKFLRIYNNKLREQEEAREDENSYPLDSMKNIPGLSKEDSNENYQN